MVQKSLTVRIYILKGGVTAMQTLKGIIIDKNFWLGCAVGFALGAMHHYLGL